MFRTFLLATAALLLFFPDSLFPTSRANAKETKEVVEHFDVDRDGENDDGENGDGDFGGGENGDGEDSEDGDGDRGAVKARYTTDGGQKSGDYLEYFRSGKLKIRAKYRKGMLNGKYEEKFESGKLKIRTTYRGGKRNGKFEERFEGGKPKIRASYRNNELHGRYEEYSPERLLKAINYNAGKIHGEYSEYDEKGLVRQQVFVHDKLLFPKSQKMIETTFAKIANSSVKMENMHPNYGYKKVLNRMAQPNQQAGHQKAMRYLKQYRYLCNVSYEDMKLDFRLTVQATAAADISVRNQGISHAPANPGMPAEEFKIAQRGCSTGNLFTCKDVDIPTILPDAIHHFMKDFGGNNSIHVGHRRWSLHPKLLRTGFGSFGAFSAMFANDESRLKAPDYDFINFPPRGLMPRSYFSSEHSWSVQPNPKKYRLTADAIKVKVFPARLSLKTGAIAKAAQPLENDVFHVDTQIRGVGPAIVFRPKEAKIAKGSTFAVEIKGIKTVEGEDYTLKYLVMFY